MNWALNEAVVPATGRAKASHLAFVLLGLANHADSEGRNAFPSVERLAGYTRLSERSVQYALRDLEELGLITRSDPSIVAAHIKRGDRRPRGWNLAMHNGVQIVHPAPTNGVHSRTSGVQIRTSRGAHSAPEPSLNHPENLRAGERRSPGEPCGKCDGRPGEPVSTRLVWLDRVGGVSKSKPCPRCHPAGMDQLGEARA
ncbi:helix-turn-helix domain-containing protein [Lentzea sp. NPDC092896]|uniref:helix-turn-helix domain-containing protein n=1 Tax=Lentzea sp. NPDC092896 TaxID=3364127 RepID=UPI0037F9DFB5